jgi:hypothetical protein
VVDHDQVVLDALDAGPAAALDVLDVWGAVVRDDVVQLEALALIEDDLDEVAAALGLALFGDVVVDLVEHGHGQLLRRRAMISVRRPNARAWSAVTLVGCSRYWRARGGGSSQISRAVAWSATRSSTQA